MLFSGLMLLLVTAFVVLILPLALIAIILLIARRLRQQYVIPVRPRLIPTPAEAVPPELGAVLTELTPALEQLGFTVAANVHAPDFGPALTWTQVLYLNRERGERASVWCLRKLPGPNLEGQSLRPVLGFATEWPDGKTVKTAVQNPTAQGAAKVYERHRHEVDVQAGSNHGKPGVVPEFGSEPQWLQERAGLVAKAMAERASFTLDAKADCYRMSWRRAISAARKASRLRRRRSGRGFSVIAQPPPLTSPDTDPLSDV